MLFSEDAGYDPCILKSCSRRRVQSDGDTQPQSGASCLIDERTGKRMQPPRKLYSGD